MANKAKKERFIIEAKYKTNIEWKEVIWEVEVSKETYINLKNSYFVKKGDIILK